MKPAKDKGVEIFGQIVGSEKVTYAGNGICVQCNAPKVLLEIFHCDDTIYILLCDVIVFCSK